MPIQLHMIARQVGCIALFASLFSGSKSFAQQSGMTAVLPPYSVAGQTIEARTADPFMSVNHERKIIRRLLAPWGREIQCRTLQQFARLLNELIPTSVDARSIDEIGLSVDEPLIWTISADQRVGATIDRVLPELDLTWMIRGEQLTILTIERAEQLLVNRMYDVTPLVGARGVSLDPRTRGLPALSDIIQQMIQPDTWEAFGGPSIATGMVVNGRTLLTVSTTSSVHMQIETLLNRINRFAYSRNDQNLATAQGSLNLSRSHSASNARLPKFTAPLQ